MAQPALTWTVRATVGRIVDGDTFVATFDLGWGVVRSETPGSPCRVRLLGYNAPERGDPDHAAATAALAEALPAGTVVWLRSHRLDAFGRALCNVMLTDGTDLVDRLPPRWRGAARA